MRGRVKADIGENILTPPPPLPPPFPPPSVVSLREVSRPLTSPVGVASSLKALSFSGVEFAFGGGTLTGVVFLASAGELAASAAAAAAAAVDAARDFLFGALGRGGLTTGGSEFAPSSKESSLLRTTFILISWFEAGIPVPLPHGESYPLPADAGSADARASSKLLVLSGPMELESSLSVNGN